MQDDSLPRIAFYAPTRDTDRQQEVRGILAYIHRTQSMHLVTRGGHPILADVQPHALVTCGAFTEAGG